MSYHIDFCHNIIEILIYETCLYFSTPPISSLYISLSLTQTNFSGYFLFSTEDFTIQNVSNCTYLICNWNNNKTTNSLNLQNQNSTKTNPSIQISELTEIINLPKEIPTPELTYKIYEINKTNFNNSDIQNTTIEFKVNKTWITANNITTIYLARYENEWNKLKTELINSTTNYNYYKSYTNSLSYFAIIGEKEELITPTNKTSQTIKNQTNQTQPIEPINQSIIGEIKPEINQTSPAPLIPEQLVYPAIGLIIIGIISGLIYFRKSQIAELLTKLKPTDNLNKRVEKIEQKIYEMKLKGEDTTEIENELELIKKDLKIGLKSIAKIRLEKVERKLKI
jgi:PGF-pre-PGF domain-containing protein